MRNLALANIFIDTMTALARQQQDEKMLYNAIQMMAFLAKGKSLGAEPAVPLCGGREARALTFPHPCAKRR